MSILSIPVEDINLIAKLVDISDEEFNVVMDLIDPFTIYKPGDIAFSGDFDGKFTNFIGYTDVLLVLRKVVHTASSYNLTSVELINDVIEQIKEKYPEFTKETDLNNKIANAYDKFFYSTKAGELKLAGGQEVSSSKIIENERAIFSEKDEIIGYTSSFQLNLTYHESEFERDIALSINYEELEDLFLSIGRSLKRHDIVKRHHIEKGNSFFSAYGEGEYDED
ncbi:hypothetical protein [Deinococcus sp.]|uniref:hypothetical protein n=1 Tax=Deinococcus sp. TaxID=47478 RepID=UPI003CC6ABF8